MIGGVWRSLILTSMALTFLSSKVAMGFLEELLWIAKPVSKNVQWLPVCFFVGARVDASKPVKGGRTFNGGKSRKGRV